MVQRSAEWQAEIDAMDKIARAMAGLDALPGPARDRVLLRVREIYFPDGLGGQGGGQVAAVSGGTAGATSQGGGGGGKGT